MHRMEQRDALLERETRSLRSHIRQLREQVWILGCGQTILLTSS